MKHLSILIWLTTAVTLQTALAQQAPTVWASDGVPARSLQHVAGEGGGGDQPGVFARRCV